MLAPIFIKSAAEPPKYIYNLATRKIRPKTNITRHISETCMQLYRMLPWILTKKRGLTITLAEKS